MGSDIYSSLSGANASWEQIDMLSQNVANSNTVGFKKSRMTFMLEGADQDSMAQAYTQAVNEGVDLSDGSLQRDGVQTHMALQGEGFFVVDANGDERLTRAGDFRLDYAGTLVNQDGHAVLGRSGPLVFEPGQDFVVDRQGRVFDLDGTELDQLRVETGDDLIQIGNNLWEAGGPTREAQVVVVEQGALEGSNADAVGLMVELIEATRYFEAYQKAMQTSDEMDQKLNTTGSR
jgi:flagellar basal-body rod protein FlgF